ncbi:hypothetical protein BS17DRAFT_327173 [Gyrodon lividus]|nr:hypothetical protein BS17DRAFT_327173 [Gyrodon lividus]
MRCTNSCMFPVSPSGIGQCPEFNPAVSRSMLVSKTQETRLVLRLQHPLEPWLSIRSLGYRQFSPRIPSPTSRSPYHSCASTRKHRTPKLKIGMSDASAVSPGGLPGAAGSTAQSGAPFLSRLICISPVQHSSHPTTIKSQRTYFGPNSGRHQDDRGLRWHSHRVNQSPRLLLISSGSFSVLQSP